ncbi:hypothetical protein AGMMS49579_26120 [Spirochaetia bacterium]|nr:hypothetical protein AGMMS49579_26120 [Spirochaetia bacterium]
MPDSLIGTRKESSLHNALKFRYAGIAGETEKSVGDYVCDGLTEDGEIIEVQTGSFGPLRQKARELAALGPVRIIHPIIINKYIETLDETGQPIRKRKSPRKGSEWDLFKNLLYAPELAKARGVCIELALIDVLERRKEDGKGSWRRKGASISGRELAGWHSSVSLGSAKDYHRFLPFTSKEEFTTRDLAKKAQISTNLAGKTLYVLTKIGIVERTGKKGNSFLYKIRKNNRKGLKRKGM